MLNMKLNESVSKMNEALEFCVHELEAQGRSESNIGHYNNYVGRFIRFYESIHADDEEVKDPTYLDVQMFRDHLESKGMKATTINLYLSTLNAFFTQQFTTLNYQDQTGGKRRTQSV